MNTNVTHVGRHIARVDHVQQIENTHIIQWIVVIKLNSKTVKIALKQN